MSPKLPVKLFEVTRWGNEDEGPNEADTNYLVLAHDHREAAALVRERLRQPLYLLDAITEMATCAPADVDQPVLLRGPYIEHKLDAGTHFTLWAWNVARLAVWVPTARRAEGVAKCSYADGRLAAEQSWKNGRAHGLSMKFHEDGTPMKVGTFERNRATGLHEWWHPSGRKASRFEYGEDRLVYQQWDAQGVLVDEGDEPRQPTR